jgi:2-polyprenyl-6-methoxyphenol hydroxylase-like FAD-dependent oxidoreductase
MDATPFQEQIGNRYDVLIQGAGIGGLTLASALQQRGYGVKIVERSAGLSEVGAGIWMAANPMQVFDRLGLAGKILDAGWIVKFIHLQDSKSGEIQRTDMSAIAKQFGFETVAIHRAVLQRILFEQLVPGTVSFGCEVHSFVSRGDSISVELSDGSPCQARILVGADGINSRIRKHVNLGGEKRYSGSSSYRAIARNANILPAEGAHDAYEVWAKGCRVGFSKVNGSDYYWYMTFDAPVGETSSTEQIRSHAESLFRLHFPQWSGLLRHTHPEEILRTDLSDLKPLPRWSSGRVGLIGDAAHATTPNLGQGGAMAVEDAFALANSFGKAGLNGTAFEQFELLRRRKVDWTVAASWSIGKICHLGNPMARGLRNAALKHTPKRVTDKQFRRLYSLEM